MPEKRGKAPGDRQAAEGRLRTLRSRAQSASQPKWRRAASLIRSGSRVPRPAVQIERDAGGQTRPHRLSGLVENGVAHRAGRRGHRQVDTRNATGKFDAIHQSEARRYRFRPRDRSRSAAPPDRVDRVHVGMSLWRRSGPPCARRSSRRANADHANAVTGNASAHIDTPSPSISVTSEGRSIDDTDSRHAVTGTRCGLLREPAGNAHDLAAGQVVNRDDAPPSPAQWPPMPPSMRVLAHRPSLKRRHRVAAHPARGTGRDNQRRIEDTKLGNRSFTDDELQWWLKHQAAETGSPARRRHVRPDIPTRIGCGTSNWMR